MSAKTVLKQRLELILQSMEDRGYQTYMVGMSYWEIELLLDIFEEEKTPEYEKGYEYGYKKAVMDMAKKIKELETYGGNKSEKRANGVPEHHARGAADMQRKLQRAGTEEGDGGNLGAMQAESEHP